MLQDKSVFLFRFLSIDRRIQSTRIVRSSPFENSYHLRIIIIIIVITSTIDDHLDTSKVFDLRQLRSTTLLCARRVSENDELLAIFRKSIESFDASPNVCNATMHRQMNAILHKTSWQAGSSIYYRITSANSISLFHPSSQSHSQSSLRDVFLDSQSHMSFPHKKIHWTHDLGDKYIEKKKGRESSSENRQNIEAMLQLYDSWQHDSEYIRSNASIHAHWELMDVVWPDLVLGDRKQSTTLPFATFDIIFLIDSTQRRAECDRRLVWVGPS